jgi:hypothetical protein
MVPCVPNLPERKLVCEKRVTTSTTIVSGDQLFHGGRGRRAEKSAGANPSGIQDDGNTAKVKIKKAKIDALNFCGL